MGGYIFWIVNCNFLGFLGGVFVYIFVGRVWEVVIVGFWFSFICYKCRYLYFIYKFLIGFYNKCNYWWKMYLYNNEFKIENIFLFYF